MYVYTVATILLYAKYIRDKPHNVTRGTYDSFSACCRRLNECTITISSVWRGNSFSIEWLELLFGIHVSCVAMCPRRGPRPYLHLSGEDTGIGAV